LLCRLPRPLSLVAFLTASTYLEREVCSPCIERERRAGAIVDFIRAVEAAA
jgi:hypothetical protein